MAKIIIVDDDEFIADMASNILFEAGHVCGWVPEGEKALELLRCDGQTCCCSITICPV